MIFLRFFETASFWMFSNVYILLLDHLCLHIFCLIDLFDFRPNANTFLVMCIHVQFL